MRQLLARPRTCCGSPTRCAGRGLFVMIEEQPDGLDMTAQWRRTLGLSNMPP
jgi:hypothetical protein